MEKKLENAFLGTKMEPFKNEECEYIDGKKTGKWINWYPSGNKFNEREYIDGKKTGKWIHWDKNGNKSYECEYINGKEI